MEIKAIETVYKGYRFRSRLEARWAVFFDEMGIEWQYEVEGFDLGGVYYLPDFWLPTFNGGMWAEVKPVDLTQIERWKAEQLCKGTSRPVWLCVGIPDTRVYEIIEMFQDEIGATVGIPLYDKAAYENRMWYTPGIEDEKGSVPEEFLWGMELHVIAINKAKSARFD